MRLAWRGCLRPCYILEIPILPPMRHHLMMANKKEFPSSSSDWNGTAVPITGNFETSGSKFSHEIAGLLASFATYRKFHFYLQYVFHLMMANKKEFPSSSSDWNGISRSNHRKFWDLGSKFSNETRWARLLASLLQFGNSISDSYAPPSYDDKQKRNFPVAVVIETA